MIVVIMIICFDKDSDIKKKVLKMRRVFGIKSLLDPSRIWFKIEDDYEPGTELNWIDFFEIISNLTLWYSLLGIIFSSIFIASYLNCNESCDQFGDRLDRFYYFFQFCLVINVLAFVYSFTTLVFAYKGYSLFKQDQYQVAKIIDEETKV